MRTTLNFTAKKYELRLCATTTAIAFLAFFCPLSSFAQIPDAATGTAAPGRIQEEFKSQRVTPSLADKIDIKEFRPQYVPDGAENIKFKLLNIKLEGVTVYPDKNIYALYEDKIGKTISLADIYSIASNLTNKYRNDGYILTQVIIPPQTIEEGVVKLRVVEGFIDNIIVEGEGEDESSLNLIRKYAAGIKLNTALNIADLEKHLLIISDLPGMDARNILSPSSTVTGAADLKIILSRDTIDASLSLDNYGSRYLGPLEFSAAGSLNSYFGNNERITVQFVGAPDSGTDAKGDLELGYYAIGYEQPFPAIGPGSTVELFASYTDTKPGYDLKEFEVEGISRYFSTKIKHPFIRSRSKNFTGYTLFDVRDVTSRNNIQNTIKDSIRTLRAGGTYKAMDSLFGLGITALNVEFSKGIDILGASNIDDSNKTRTFGNPRFSKLTANIQRLQRLTSEINLLIEANGQWASSALLSSEEFGVGGSNIGRGYDSSEIIGDEGVAGKLEVQWNNPYKNLNLQDYQFFAFYDAGRTWNKDATTSSQKRDTIASSGIGVRMELDNEVEADLTLALPLNRDVQTKGDQGVSVLFKINRSF